jgi:hypothetical protein
VNHADAGDDGHTHHVGRQWLISSAHRRFDEAARRGSLGSRVRIMVDDVG